MDSLTLTEILLMFIWFQLIFFGFDLEKIKVLLKEIRNNGKENEHR